MIGKRQGSNARLRFKQIGTFEKEGGIRDGLSWRSSNNSLPKPISKLSRHTRSSKMTLMFLKSSSKKIPRD